MGFQGSEEESKRAEERRITALRARLGAQGVENVLRASEELVEAVDTFLDAFDQGVWLNASRLRLTTANGTLKDVLRATGRSDEQISNIPPPSRFLDSVRKRDLGPFVRDEADDLESIPSQVRREYEGEFPKEAEIARTPDDRISLERNTSTPATNSQVAFRMMPDDYAKWKDRDLSPLIGQALWIMEIETDYRIVSAERYNDEMMGAGIWVVAKR